MTVHPFVTRTVRARVPATSANLGPGFDCLGLALELADEYAATVVDQGLDVAVVGEGADELPSDEAHLVVRSMREAFAALDVHPPGLQIRCTIRIPHRRGLGSSSAAIVGGLVLARALVSAGTDGLDDQALLALANRMEGHPDNVAPALLGGFVVCGQQEGDVWAQRVPVHPALSAVLFVPPTGISTELARGLLPESVPHQVAAANAGRAALVVAALGGAPAQLLRATEDFLHQEHRGPAMPESLELVHRLRSDGIPAVVSGAGPSVLAFVGTGDGFEVATEDVESRCPEGWHAVHQDVGGPGASVLV